MRRLRHKQKSAELLKDLEHISLSKKDAKTKQDFIREARQIAQTYSQHRRNPAFKYFMKHLIENLVYDCDTSFMSQIINDLRRVFSKRVNENFNDESNCS